MAKKIVSLYIDDTSLRLMESRGKRITKLAEAQLQLSSAEVNDDIKETELISKIKHLLQSHKVKTKKIILGISGYNCMTRPLTLPQLPKAMLDEAVTREARRVLPVPLDQLYLSWQTYPVTDGKMQAFVVAMPCRTIDTLLKILRQAGLKPYLMDIKPLALARVVKEANAIIIDVQPTEFDIIIMANGIPQPIRTIPFPGETQSHQDKLSMVSDDLRRTIEFYNTNNPQNPLDPDTPMLITGEVAEKLQIGKALSSELGYPSLPLSSPLKNPKNLDLTNYLVNVGLILKELEKEAETSIVNVNTLPTPYRAKPVPLSRIIAVPTTVAVVALIVGGVMTLQIAAAKISDGHAQLDNSTHILEQKQATKKDLTADIAKLDSQIAQAKATGDSINKALNTIDSNSSIINGNLQVTTSSLLSSVSLTNIYHANDQLVINGKAPTEEDILAYARTLKESGRFIEVTVSHIGKVIVQDTSSVPIEEGTGEEEGTEQGTGEETVSAENEEMEFTLILRIGGSD